MNTSSEALIMGCVAAAAIGYGAWRHFHQAAPAHLAVGDDASLSVERNCAGLRGETAALLKRAEIREGSTLTFLAMSGNPADPEPELRLHEPVPVAGDRVYGQAEQQRQYEAAMTALLDGVESACEQAEDARHTPLYQLVRQGLNHLRSGELGCGDDGRCFFLVKTDLLEDVHPELREWLEKAARGETPEAPAHLVRSLDNGGIEVAFCGTSELRAPTKKAPPAAPVEARQRIWRELFTRPELVSFRPFCVAQNNNR